MARTVPEQPKHLSRFWHIGDTGNCFCHSVECLGIGSHEVDSGDMHVDVMRLLAVHLGPENRILEHQLFRYDAGFEDFAPAIDILDVKIERLDPLLEAGAQNIPLGRGEDARQHIKRDKPLLRVRLTVDSKGDADAAEQHLRLRRR